MAEKQKLFVSYSHADKSICKEITTALEQECKLNIWFDESLVPGEEYRKMNTTTSYAGGCVHFMYKS